MQGNFIGTNATGTAALGNSQAGVEINGASSNIVGGATSATLNVISGNTTGVYITDASGAATCNEVEANNIGTNAAGLAVIPNTYGVVISGTGAGTPTTS